VKVDKKHNETNTNLSAKNRATAMNMKKNVKKNRKMNMKRNTRRPKDRNRIGRTSGASSRLDRQR
jgi:hypothetical protein